MKTYRKTYSMRSRIVMSILPILVSTAFCYAAGVFSRAAEWFGKLFAKRDVLLWEKGLPVIQVFKGVYSLKPDKVREFFSFLRVKQSWMPA